MKRSCLWSLACLAALVEVRAQVGTVNFANGTAQVTAPVIFKSSGVGVSGLEWKIELLVQTSSNLVSIAGPVSFESGTLAGYFFAGSVAVPQTLPGQSATFVLRVFNTATQISVQSELITVTLGGGIAPPANLLGLTSLEVPSLVSLSITRTEQQVVLSWPKEASNMLLQSSAEFPPIWKNLAVPKITGATSISTTLDFQSVQQFFRLTSGQSN